MKWRPGRPVTVYMPTDSGLPKPTPAVVYDDTGESWVAVKFGPKDVFRVRREDVFPLNHMESTLNVTTLNGT